MYGVGLGWCKVQRDIARSGWYKRERDGGMDERGVVDTIAT